MKFLLETLLIDMDHFRTSEVMVECLIEAVFESRVTSFEKLRIRKRGKGGAGKRERKKVTCTCWVENVQCISTGFPYMYILMHIYMYCAFLGTIWKCSSQWG